MPDGDAAEPARGGRTAAERANASTAVGGVLADVRSGNTSSLPSSWRWDGVAGQSYVTRVFQQNEPQYCGASWAASALGALADRVKIARAAQHTASGQPDLELAAQTLLDCGDEVAARARGGYPAGVWQWARHRGGAPS